MWQSVLFLLLMGSPAQEGSIYTFVNPGGVRVITNVGGTRAIDEEAVVPGSETWTAREHPYSPLISQAAERHSVDASLIEAIISVESAFDRFAVSNKGCEGLMQLHPDTAKRFGVTNAFDPAQNIDGGVQYLRFLMHHFDDDLTRVLAAYNAGENAVERFGGIPPYAETQDYVKKVLARYQPPSTDEDKEPVPPRIQRVTLPDGRILLTNTTSR